MATSAGKNISYGNRHMATLWNPFSYKNNEPKYPDGLASYSIGRKWTNLTRVTGEEVTIILYPGLLGWCCIATQSGDQGNATFKKADIHHTLESVEYTHDESFTNVGVLGEPDYKGSFHTWVVSKNKYSAWRPVSCAVKIKTTSRQVGLCGKNDGWWEAIRTAKIINSEDFGLQATAANSDNQIAPLGTLVPTSKYMEEANTSQNWSLSPSYATGNINELAKYTFQLNQIRNDNRFVDITDIYFDYPEEKKPDHLHTEAYHKLEYPDMRSNPALVTYNDNSAVVTYPRAAKDSVFLAEDNVDNDVRHLFKAKGYETTHSDALDIIIIKLHGTDTSEYMISSVMNQEFLANDTDLKDYQTTSYSAIRELEEYLAIRSRDYKLPNHSYYNKKMKF